MDEDRSTAPSTTPLQAAGYNETYAGTDLVPAALSLSQVRHDLRTPLNQIIGYTELLMEEVQDVGEASLLPDLHRIRNAGNLLLSHINEYFGTPARTDPEPQLPDFTRAVVAPNAGHGAARTDQSRILLVDDHPANLEVLSRRLERQDHFVRTAGNGHEALEILRIETFDLVLLDVIMPEMDGYTVLQQMKQDANLRHIPVIVISALGELDSVVRCIELGAEDYLTKPFNPILLRARIGACLEKKRLRDMEQLYLAQIAHEQARSERLLRNILPDAIARRLKDKAQGEATMIADRFDEVTVLFADLVGFTRLAAEMPPDVLIGHLNAVFSAFDALVEACGLEKIKTIGDAYMVVGGLPTPRADHAEAVADLALAMQREIVRLRNERGLAIKLRVGIHTGPVVAGVIGLTKFAYDLWGDTVNVANRMEIHGEPDRIHVSEEFRGLLADGYTFADTAEREIKDKGILRTSFLVDRQS
jgi:adenylate cyclase